MNNLKLKSDSQSGNGKKDSTVNTLTVRTFIPVGEEKLPVVNGGHFVRWVKIGVATFSHDLVNGIIAQAGVSGPGS